MESKIRLGDKVIFDYDSIALFEVDTEIDSAPIQQYRKLVLAGIDQVGIVKEMGTTMSTVLFADGWELPIPTKYLAIAASH